MIVGDRATIVICFKIEWNIVSELVIGGDAGSTRPVLQKKSIDLPMNSHPCVETGSVMGIAWFKCGIMWIDGPLSSGRSQKQIDERCAIVDK